MKIQQGAEAVIHLKNGRIVKERISKSYRHPELDSKIRKKTTRSETRLLERAGAIVPTPKILNSCDKEMKIEMEHIKGEKLRDQVANMSPKERADVFTRLGKKTAMLHNANIIHGDLTTSNIIYNGKVNFIDFGLGSISPKIEDKAVDLHLLKQALASKHHEQFDECFEAVIAGYSKESKEFKQLNEQLKKVESRGRYKNKK
ncbi:MAG: KEOPS complex kinase/ATPase Bud32 [archaeon]